MRVKILQDLISVAVQCGAPPAWSDEAAVAVWVGKLASGLVPVAYDVILSAPQAFASGPPTASEIEAAYGKIGDGTLLAWLKTVDWASVLQTVITIISIIPKTPAPTPAT